MNIINFGLCRDCKHWGVSYGGVCDWIEMCGENEPAHISFDTHDDSGLVCKLVTKPNFGCTVFKKRNNKI